MRKKRLKLMIMAILLFVIEPGFVYQAADAAGNVVTKSYTATMDTMELDGHIQYDGIHDNDGDGFLSIGRSNDEFGDVRQRAGVTFDLGVPEGNIVSAELVLTVATVIRNPNHTLYMEARGSAANDLTYSSFPSVDMNSPFADRFTALSIAEAPMGTYLQNQSITFNVKSAVDAFTDSSDRRITFTLNGNEAEADSGWFSIHSLETYGNAAYRPKLIVTYETGPVNNPPVGSFTIAEGAATNASTINLSITGSDADAGDSVTHMRFANSAANLSAASWLPFSNTATFSLAGGDGSKSIYMQLRDSNNGISANSSQTILLDQTAPIGTLIINDGATWANTNMVTLKGTYTDGSGSGVDQVRLSNISGSWQTSWFSIADLNGKSWVLPAGEGVKTVYVQYKDKVGNTSDATISSTITVDTIAPVISNVANGKSYNSKVNALFNEGSGLLNGNSYTSGTDITQDGEYTLIVTDPAGNSTTVNFKIDTTAPIVTGVTNGGIYKANVTVTFNKGTATLNGAAFTSGMQIVLNGVYTLVVTDGAGNVTTVKFDIDTEAPIVTGVTDGGIYKEKITVTFNEGTATLNGAAFTSGTEIEQDGTYTLVVTDAAGNITTVSFEINKTSANANLSNLTLSAGTLSPSFDKTKKSYIASVPYEVTSVDVVATVENSKATLKVKGSNATSGTAMPLALSAGSNIVEVEVTAQDGTTKETYTIEVTRAGASMNASLSNLTFSKGTLSPTFDKVKARYTVSVPYDTTNLNVTAIVEDSKASLKVNGSDVSSGAVKQIPLSVGVNVIKIVVTAQDGATKKFYTIEVTREKQQLSAPTDVKAFAGDRSVTISFTASANNGGSPITHYEVVSSTGVIVATGTSSPITITRLTNGMTYTFSVRAVNREGAGALSIASNASTPHGSSSNSGSGSDSGSSPNDKPISTINGKLTLPAGVAGETKLNDEISVSIPADATDHTLRLVVEKVLDTADLANHGEVFASPVFELLKNFSDNFKKPVTLTMKFDPSKVKTGQRASIFYFDETNKVWIEVGGQVRGNTITATIDHFTKFAVLVVNDASQVPEQETEQEPESAHFSDIVGHWAEAMIKEVVEQGIVKGYPDGTFNPNEAISRKHIAALLARSLQLEPIKDEISFRDIPATHPYYDEIRLLQQAGIIDGYADGTYRPDEPVTRVQMAKMLALAFDLQVKDDVGFPDVPATHWGNEYVLALYSNGITTGDNGLFKPGNPVTRAHFVAFLYRAMHLTDEG